MKGHGECVVIIEKNNEKTFNSKIQKKKARTILLRYFEKIE